MNATRRTRASGGTGAHTCARHAVGTHGLQAGADGFFSLHRGLELGLCARCRANPGVARSALRTCTCACTCTCAACLAIHRTFGVSRCANSHQGTHCRIGVLDHGPGIAPEQLEAVFQPFHRLDTSRSPATGGSGLGQAIVRELARANDWQIALEANPGGGLQAWLELPQTGPSASLQK